MWRIITVFFRWTWRLLNVIREFILNLLFILLILAGVGVYLQTRSTSIETPPQGALLVDLKGVVIDKPPGSNKLRQWIRELPVAANNRQENSLYDVVNAIRLAKTDKNITGIVLSLSDFSGTDQPSLQYIGQALREFRNSDKPIFAIGDSYNQIQYYLASFANEIYLSPQGSVALHGFATNNLYYKSLLDKLKVSTHIFRVGEYKSAVEPQLLDGMSQEAREADRRWVGGLWQNYLHEVAANRQLTPEQAFPGAADLLSGLQAVGGDTAQYAINKKLVDRLASRLDTENRLVEVFGWNEKSNNFNYTSIYDYQPPPVSPQGEHIAVIFANGAIVDGTQSPGVVGADTTAAQIRRARLDPDIKALVLRVNSPGGSVSASEVIRAELAAVRSAGKPVVVSMGGIAASGGYWISTPADYIIASASTLTGSIGIFGVINTFENSLDSIGVHTDGVATSPLADLSVTKALPAEFSQMVQMNIENGYNRFIELVATSRGKTSAQIEEIAQGRVWIGSDAQNNGLVDQLGNFDDAVRKAAELAALDSYQLTWFVDPPSLSEMIIAQIGVSAVHAFLPAPLSTMVVKEQLRFFNKLNDPQHRYALCLACGEVG